MQKWIKLLTIWGLLVATQNAISAPITNSHVLELAVHRLERLTELKKIDGNFARKLAALRLTVGNTSDIPNGAYAVLVSQSPGADQSVNQIQLIFSTEGKAIKELPVANGGPAGEPTWPDASPLSFIENAFHYLLEHGEGDAALKPFIDSAIETTIEQIKDNGQVFAKIRVTNSQNSQVLEIILNANGSIASVKVN